MKRLLPLILLLFAVSVTRSQTGTVTLTFTGCDINNQYCQLNRVIIHNLTKGWTETITWPDTTLIMQVGTGVEDYVTTNTLELLPSTPNPFNGVTDVTLFAAHSGDVAIHVIDAKGQLVASAKNPLQPGQHQYRVQLVKAGIYFLTARQNGKSSTVKMVNNGRCAMNSVEYVGAENTNQTLPQDKGGIKGSTNNPFSYGDQMEYVGYATNNGTELESQHILQDQNESQDFLLQFPTLGEPVDGGPCPGAATVTDIDGNVYPTVLLGQQCWMQENLRATRYADGTIIDCGSTSSFNVAYRYYPNNDSNNVSSYGYLYNWKAVMNNSTSISNPGGVQGICPTGWHVPSEAEWTQLLTYVGSQSPYIYNGDSTCVAKALASTRGWESNPTENTPGYDPETNNATGFSALPAGAYATSPYNFGSFAYFWSATEENVNIARRLFLQTSNSIVTFSSDVKSTGVSVRCVKN